MRHHRGFSLAVLASMAPFASANGGDDDLSKVHVPALRAVTVTATPGKGITFDAGDDFKLNVYNRVQVQWRFSNIDEGPDVHTFRIRRARTRFKGHVFSPETEYSVYLDWAQSGSNVLDVYIKQHLWSNDKWKLKGRAGVGKTQYGREATGSSGKLELPERSIAARTFSDVRSTGLLGQLSGELSEQMTLNAYAGIWNHDTAAGSTFSPGRNSLNADNETSYSVGARLDLNGDMGGESYSQGDLKKTEEINAAVEGNIWIGNEKVPAGANAGADVEIFGYNVGGAVKYQGFHGLAGFFGYTSDEDVGGSQESDSLGWVVQGSFTQSGGQLDGWGVAGRVSAVDIDTVGAGSNLGIVAPSGGSTGGGTTLAAPGDVVEFEIGLNRYFNGHDRKVQASVTFQQVDFDAGGATDPDNIIFRVMATLGI